MNKVSRKDVAEYAGVTETIVSYVLNDNRYVKKEKKEAVLNAVKVLGYKPNRFARALKGKELKHILLLLDRIRTEYAGEIITEVDRFSENLGYMVSVSIIENNEEFVKKILEWQVSGVVISSIYFDEKHIQTLADAGIAVVVFESREYPNLEGVTLINTGLYKGAKISVEYLYNAGCRKIGYVDRVSAKGTFSTYSDKRLKGYTDAMNEFGLEPIIISNCYSTEELERKLSTLFLEKKIDGLFCRTDEMAVIALNTAHRCGLNVPQDISVIGLDNSALSRSAFPKLTSVKLDRSAFSEAAVHAIEHHSATRMKENERLTFEPSLVIRESVKEE